MTDELRLLQILNARFLHDLSSSVGTVYNCLSLIDTANKDIGNKAKLLAIEESGNLTKKIKVFRGVYASPDGDEQMSVVYLTKLFQDFFSNNNKLELDLKFETGVLYLESLLAKASLCLVMIISEASVLGGKLAFICGNDNGNNFTRITFNSKDLKWSDETWDILNGKKNKEINIKNCREFYIRNLCEKSGYKITSNKKANSIECEFLKV
jgi:hypothetical protein